MPGMLKKAIHTALFKWRKYDLIYLYTLSHCDCILLHQQKYFWEL